MDSRLIEVVMGLALVFAVASLAATAMQEVMDSLRSSRGRIAMRQVVSFVGDDQAFAEALLRHPLLVSLAQGTLDSKTRRPSWVNADTMVSALLDTLFQQHAGGVRPSSPMALVHALGGGTAGAPGARLAQSLASLVHGVEQDWPAFERRIAAWYGDVGERSVGWFKRQTQVSLFIVGLVLAAALNINPFLIAQRLWLDPALRKATADAAQDAAAVYSAQSSASGVPANATPAPVVPLSPAPRAKAVDEVETALAGLRERVAAALRPSEKATDPERSWIRAQQADQALRALEPLLDARRAPDDQSAASLRRRLGADRDLELALAEVDRLLPRTADTAGLQADFAVLREKVRAEAAAPRSGDAGGRRKCADLPDAEQRELCVRLQDFESLRRLGLPLGWGEATRFTPFAEPTANWLATLAGWMVLALGCTLGAPFWFDLIKQLAKLRAPAGQPGSTPGSTAAQSVSDEVSTLTRSATDTGEPPNAVMSDALNDAERAMTEAEIERVQRALGLTDAELSRRFDARTREAIRDWQSRRAYAATGELSAAQIAELLQAGAAGDDDYIG
jgi:hypothetical protein